MTQAKGKHAGGQPTKFKPEFCQTIIDFFSEEPYEDKELPHYQKDGKTLAWMDYKRFPKKLPTLVQFSKHIKVCYSTVYNWQKEGTGSFQEEFLQAFMQAKDLQKDFLIQNGLQGLYNPLFAKFTAINITDMKDKQEYEHSGSVEHTFPPEVLDIAKKMAESFAQEVE